MTVHSLLSPRLTRGRKKAGHIHLIDMAGFNAIPRQAWELYGFWLILPGYNRLV